MKNCGNRWEREERVFDLAIGSEIAAFCACLSISSTAKERGRASEIAAFCTCPARLATNTNYGFCKGTGFAGVISEREREREREREVIRQLRLVQVRKTDIRNIIKTLPQLFCGRVLLFAHGCSRDGGAGWLGRLGRMGLMGHFGQMVQRRFVHRLQSTEYIINHNILLVKLKLNY